MSDLLNEIYYAAIDAMEMPPEWRKQIHLLTQTAEAFEAALPTEVRALYEKWDRARYEVNSLEMKETFYQGVRLGLSLGELS